MREGFGAEEEDAGDVNIRTGDQRFQTMLCCFLLHDIQDTLDVFFGSFLLEQCEDFAALGRERCLIVCILEGRDVLFLRRRDERVVVRRQSVAHAFGKGELDLLVERTNDEGLLRTEIAEFELGDPAVISLAHPFIAFTVEESGKVKRTTQPTST